MNQCYFWSVSVAVLMATVAFGENNSREVEEFKHYRNLANKGDIEAQYFLGGCYRYGEGTEADLTQAIKWYKLAADQGHLESQRVLGGCYYYGEGVEKNMKEAFKYHRLAADQGDAVAQWELANSYYFG